MACVGTYWCGAWCWMLFSRKPFLVSCLVGFLGASVGCIIAPAIDVLLALRVVQGRVHGAPR